VGDLGSLGPRTGALFGPRAETGNKKFRKKIEESKRGARGICRFCHMVNPALVQFNAVFNAMRTLPDLTRIYLYQSFIKTAINTAITVKLLTSKVTALNTCEKLKMTHEKQLDVGNIKSKVNETCYCETCLSQSTSFPGSFLYVNPHILGVN
jgi:hypothetical protein